MKRLFPLAALLAASALGQTVVNGSRNYIGGIEAGDASYFRPMTVNGVPPSVLCNTALSITSSTNATPIVITKNAHGLSNGQVITVYGHGVNTSANGTWMVGSATANTFALCGYWDGTTCQSPAVGIAGGGNSGFFSTQVGRVALRNDATPGQNWYFCTDSTGSPAWTQQLNSGGGGGVPGGVSGQVEYNNSGAFGGFTPTGDVSLSIPNVTVLKIDGTSVPVNSAADQVLLTTGVATGAWASIPSCLDSAGQHLNYNTSTHVWSCGTTSSGSGIGGSGTANSFSLFTGVTTIGNGNLQQPLDGSVNAVKALTWAAAYKPTFNGAGTTTCDLSQSNVCEVDFGAGNTTLALSTPHGSGPYTLRSCQDATGNRVYTAFPGNAVGFTQPRAAANACTELPFTYDGTNYNAGVSPGSGTISEINDQTGTTYTFVSGDCGRLVRFTNAGAIAATLPQAGAAFPARCRIYTKNIGLTAVTITPTTSTIDGLSSIVLAANQSAAITSDGTNYVTDGSTYYTISGQTTGCALRASSGVTANNSMDLCQDPAGDIYGTKAIAFAPGNSLAYVNAGTTTLDASVANAYSLACTTAGGTTTLAISNPPTGSADFTLWLVQNGTTACSITYPASFKANTVPGFSPTLNSTCWVKIAYNSVSSQYFGIASSCDDLPGVINIPEASSTGLSTVCIAGRGCIRGDSVNHILTYRGNNSATDSNTVVPQDCTTGGNNAATKIASTGVVSCANVISSATGSLGTVTSGHLACLTGSNTMGNCTALPPNNIVGVFVSSTAYQSTGITSVSLDATQNVVFGDLLCASATGASLAHDNGSTPCTLGEYVGVVTTSASSVSSATASLRLN